MAEVPNHPDANLVEVEFALLIFDGIRAAGRANRSKPRCCQNGACQGGECCVDEICVAEGESCHGRGIVSENTSGVCVASKCECGSPGQPCCGLR